MRQKRQIVDKEISPIKMQKKNREIYVQERNSKR